MSMQIALQPVFVGAVATLVLDAWALALNRAFGVPITNWGLVGRWVAGFPAGALTHADISAAPGVAHERLMGWSTHYLIGIVYATLYMGLLTAFGMTPGVYSAVAFGLVTVLAPWLILQPCLGTGYFAKNAPRPNLTRLLNLLAHIVFGFGLYVGTKLISQ